MNGRANRRRGHDCERAVAAWLRDRGYPDAHTTRARLGHDGTRQPGDVVGPVGLVISAKDVAASCWPTWCRQAAREADGRPWVVVRRLRGTTEVGEWPCRFGRCDLVETGRATFAAFLEQFDDTFNRANTPEDLPCP